MGDMWKYVSDTTTIVLSVFYLFSTIIFGLVLVYKYYENNYFKYLQNVKN